MALQAGICCGLVCFVGGFLSGGIFYLNRASNLEEYLDAATFESCTITDIEEVSCTSSSSRGAGTAKRYYIYYGISEKCGNQTLEGNLDFMRQCSSGTSHREDEGQYDCYVAECDEETFVLESTAEKVGKWESAGIIFIVLSSLCCICPLLALLYMVIAS